MPYGTGTVVYVHLLNDGAVLEGGPIGIQSGEYMGVRQCFRFHDSPPFPQRRRAATVQRSIVARSAPLQFHAAWVAMGLL